MRVALWNEYSLICTSLAYSLFVRLLAPEQENHTCKITCKKPVLAVLQRTGEVPNGV